MIKNKVILLLIVLISTVTYGQFGPQQIISNEDGLKNDVYAADLDGDGDMDVLSSSQQQISGMKIMMEMVILVNNV
jgi:hypothetical protein